jgi:hypothetical protein
VWFRRRPENETAEVGLSGAVEWPSRYEPIRPLIPEAGVTGVPRQREWDAVVFAEAAGIRDDPVVFVALPDGDLLVEVGDEPGDLTPLAEAVERECSRPYRAQAVRKDGDRFAVGVVAIEVAALPGTAGESVTLTVREGVRELEVDGRRGPGRDEGLERLGARAGRSFVVRAERLQDDLFEVRVDRL